MRLFFFSFFSFLVLVLVWKRWTKYFEYLFRLVLCVRSARIPCWVTDYPMQWPALARQRWQSFLSVSCPSIFCILFLRYFEHSTFNIMKRYWKKNEKINEIRIVCAASSQCVCRSVCMYILYRLCVVFITNFIWLRFVTLFTLMIFCALHRDTHTHGTNATPRLDQWNNVVKAIAALQFLLNLFYFLPLLCISNLISISLSKNFKLAFFQTLVNWIVIIELFMRKLLSMQYRCLTVCSIAPPIF